MMKKRKSDWQPWIKIIVFFPALLFLLFSFSNSANRVGNNDTSYKAKEGINTGESVDQPGKLKTELYGNQCNESILADAALFQYLIGMEYSDFSELGNFTKHSRSSRTYPNGEKISSANLVQGDKQIITSEITTLDEHKNMEVHKIQDIIVLNGFYSTCGGCLLSKNKKNTILTIYSFGTTDDDSLLIAFERDRKTGSYSQVNPDDLERNPNYLMNRNEDWPFSPR